MYCRLEANILFRYFHHGVQVLNDAEHSIELLSRALVSFLRPSLDQSVLTGVHVPLEHLFCIKRTLTCFTLWDLKALFNFIEQLLLYYFRLWTATNNVIRAEIEPVVISRLHVYMSDIRPFSEPRTILPCLSPTRTIRILSRVFAVDLQA